MSAGDTPRFSDFELYLYGDYEKTQGLKCTICMLNSAYQIYDKCRNLKSWKICEDLSREISQNIILKATTARCFIFSAWIED